MRMPKPCSPAKHFSETILLTLPPLGRCFLGATSSWVKPHTDQIHNMLAMIIYLFILGPRRTRPTTAVRTAGSSNGRLRDDQPIVSLGRRTVFRLLQEQAPFFITAGWWYVRGAQRLGYISDLWLLDHGGGRTKQTSLEPIIVVLHLRQTSLSCMLFLLLLPVELFFHRWRKQRTLSHVATGQDDVKHVIKDHESSFF